MLYDRGNYQLATPQPLSPAKRKKKAQKYFTYWSGKASKSFWGYSAYLKRSSYNESAFNLHQATERYYVRSCVKRKLQNMIEVSWL